MIEDFNHAGTADPDCDVCIIGSGPVGIAMALQFLATQIRVVVLESGGDRHETEVDALSAFENAGHRRVHPSAVRRRIFGGTSTIWSGRCVPFSPLDLQARDWIPGSGWPVSQEELAPWLQRAGRILQTGPALYDERLWAVLGTSPHRKPWDPSRFETQVFQASVIRHPRTREIPAAADPAAENHGALSHSGAPQAEDIAEHARERLQAAPNIRVLLHAHALEVETDGEGARVESVRIGSLDGRRASVRARHVVLACGGIDNARLLLLSRSRHASGLGNRFDQVGRYLADHHYAAVATIGRTQAARLRRRMGPHWLDLDGSRYVYITGVSLAAQRQREERLPRSTLYLFEHGLRPAAMTSLRRIAAGLGGGTTATAADWGAALLHPLEIAQGMADRYVHRRPTLAPISRLDVGCNVEQIPDPGSRVMLGDARDAFDQPLARLDWRLDEREYECYRKSTSLFIAECRRLGLEVPEVSPWIAQPTENWREHLHDMAHPMCTTRMSDAPRDGVVDRHCQVHGIEGLHVAGSSVFRTGGTSNPTLTAVALGLRLAARIRTAIEAPLRVESVTAPRVRVGIIGAGHRVRQMHAPVLTVLQERLEVVGITSRRSESRDSVADERGWRAFPSPHELVAQARPDFLLIAVSGEANPAVLHAVMGFGVPLLAETPLCWSERDGQGLVARARGSGVPLGITEQFPFTPAEQLKRKLLQLGAIGPVTAAVNEFASYDYHGLAQLRSYAGRGSQPLSVTAQRFRFGRTGMPEGAQPAIPELGWPEEWQLGAIRMSGGVLLLQQFSAGFAVLPTRPRGTLKVFGQSGSLVDDRAVFVDRGDGTRVEHRFERTADAIGVSHPRLGRIEWRHPLLRSTLPDEQIAVALHLEAFAEVVRERAAPLYTGAEALGDIELLRALHYSAENGGRSVRLPLRTRLEKVRVLGHRILHRGDAG